jgi:hypothetical protein
VLDVASRVILLNGASSSGKSSLAAAIQAALPEPFLRPAGSLVTAPGVETLGACVTRPYLSTREGARSSSIRHERALIAA